MADSPVIVRYISELQDYPPIYQAMQDFTRQRTAEQADEIWLMQHRPVFTKGLATKPEHLHDTARIPVIQTDRGGQVTYHGPGQLMAYLLIDHQRAQLGARALVSLIEKSVIALLADFGITAQADPQAPGVYTGKGKIAALGLKIARKGTYHGLCLNVCANLHPFERINPCGVEKAAIAQVCDYVEKSHLPDMQSIAQQLGTHLLKPLSRTGEWHLQSQLTD